MKGLDFFFLTWLATRELLVRHKNPRLGESESALLGAAALFPSIPMDSCNPRLVVITKYPSVAFLLAKEIHAWLLQQATPSQIPPALDFAAPCVRYVPPCRWPPNSLELNQALKERRDREMTRIWNRPSSKTRQVIRVCVCVMARKE